MKLEANGSFVWFQKSCARKQRTAWQGLFDDAPSVLHHPPAGFDRAGSFKTPDKYGNLQLTFFVKVDDWVADIDIHDAAGLEHVFPVVRNKLSGKPTHPYSIHEILVAHQKIDPGYTFVV